MRFGIEYHNRLNQVPVTQVNYMRPPISSTFIVIAIITIATHSHHTQAQEPASAAAATQAGDKDKIQVGPNDWPWWRGPNGNGVAATNQKPPVKWSDSENILWKVALPGRGHASPTIMGDQVFIPTADHAKGEQIVLCFDRNTGKLNWKTTVHRGGLMKGNRKASQASPTIACDGQRLFVNFLNKGAAHTTALTREGKIIWQQKICKYIVHQGLGSSPLPYKHLVIVSADNKSGGAIAAFHRTTGELAWRVSRPKKPNYPSPTVVQAAGKQQLVFMGCDLVSSFNPITGKQLWQFDGSTTECVSTTVTDGTHIFTSGGYPKNHVAAMRADGSGKVVWQNSERVYVPSMLVRNDYLFAVTDPGSAICWKSDTGERGWKKRLGGGFTASPILVGDKIYAVNEKGDCYIFNANPKAFELIAKNKLGNEVLATPAICGSRIYMRVAHKTNTGRTEMLYCIANAAK
jgi:outer membrane protein assembly factor BamB